MSTYVVAVEGLEDIRDIENLDKQVVLRARQAINTTLRRSRTAIDRDIRQQVAFKARYLSGRLRIAKYAQGSDLEGTIIGSDRPTSLARFSTGGKPFKGGVSVVVSPGGRKRMNRAFLMPLKGGNIGLAIRLKAGESVRNKKHMAKVSKGLYLLYGPAVNQVFAGVAEDNVGDIETMLQTEFLRLMELDS